MIIDNSIISEDNFTFSSFVLPGSLVENCDFLWQYIKLYFTITDNGKEELTSTYLPLNEVISSNADLSRSQYLNSLKFEVPTVIKSTQLDSTFYNPCFYLYE